MNTALRIVLFVTPLCLITACNDGSQPKPAIASLNPLPTNPYPDTTIPYKLPLLSGAWKGIGKDRGRTFTWTVNKGQLEGTYQANKNAKEDYSKMFRFRIQDGILCCLPGDYGGKCSTPDGTYRLTKQTDSSYTFEAERHPLNKTISILQFSFEGQNRMKFSWKHEYEDYPDINHVRHFQKSM